MVYIAAGWAGDFVPRTDTGSNEKKNSAKVLTDGIEANVYKTLY